MYTQVQVCISTGRTHQRLNEVLLHKLLFSLSKEYPGGKDHQISRAMHEAQWLPQFLAQSRQIMPSRAGEKWMTMVFILCTNIAVVRALARCSPVAEGFIPCGPELLNASFFVSDLAEISELERFWAWTREKIAH